jgi:hypothetical protein
LREKIMRRYTYLTAMAALAVGFSACAAVPPAARSSSAATPPSITGSRIAPTGTAPATAQPIQQLSSRDIQLSGQTDTAAALQRLLPNDR